MFSKTSSALFLAATSSFVFADNAAQQPKAAEAGAEGQERAYVTIGVPNIQQPPAIVGQQSQPTSVVQNAGSVTTQNSAPSSFGNMGVSAAALVGTILVAAYF